MALSLRPHPETPCPAVGGIAVDIAGPIADRLLVSFLVTGAIEALRFPPVVEPRRCDGLWRHTCFEAFVGTAPAGPYYEFNLAPSTCWAAYRFTGYRAGMAVAAECEAIPIMVEPGPDRFALTAALPLDRLSALPRENPWRLALAAVIEETDGRLSYWALAHPPGLPDFHHADGFAHALEPA